MSETVWQDVVETNLTGTWNTMVVSVPHSAGRGGGSIICTGSTAALKGLPFLAPYVAAKHGIVGIAKTMANELGAHRIRVNTVHPAGVETPMLEALGALDALIAGSPELGPIYTNVLPVERLSPADVSDAACSWPRRSPAT